MNEWGGKGKKKRRNLDEIYNCLAKQMFLSDFQRLKEILENVNTPTILWLPDVESRLLGKDLEAGKIDGRRRREWQRMRWLGGITRLPCPSPSPGVWASSRRWWRTGKPGELQALGWQSRTQLSKWTDSSNISAPVIIKEMSPKAC